MSESDLVCLGELLVDFVPTVQGKRLRQVTFFEKTAGGAPANVAAGFSRLGGRSAFVGKVGEDEFGCFLGETLAEAGVDTSHLLRTRECLTGLAFVSLRADGERDFMFYRQPAADMLLRPEEVPWGVLDAAQVFHYGSVSLISSPAREATLTAAEYAARRHKLVSYDPNLRPSLWPSLDDARDGIRAGLPYAVLLKVCEEELAFVAGDVSAPASAARLFAEYPRLRLIAVTRGGSGCELHVRRGSASARIPVPGFAVRAVDGTGAGDGFTAGLLRVLQRELGGDRGATAEALDWDASDDFWYAAGRFANAVGALVVTKRGGIPAMPVLAEVEEFLNKAHDLRHVRSAR